MLYIVLIICFLCFFFYLRGKEEQKEEIIKDNQELQRQYNKNEIKDYKEIDKKLRQGKFIILLSLFLFSCSHNIISTNCPPISSYSIEFENNLANDILKSNSYYIKQAILDYGNLRNNLRTCYGK